MLLVTAAPAGTRGLDAVNELLARGWLVVSVTPMGAGGASDAARALVLLERAGDDATAVLARIEEEVEESLDGDGSDLPLPRVGLGEEENPED